MCQGLRESCMRFELRSGVFMGADCSGSAMGGRLRRKVSSQKNFCIQQMIFTSIASAGLKSDTVRILLFAFRF